MSGIERTVEESVPQLQEGGLLRRGEIKKILRQRIHYSAHKSKYTRLDFMRYLEFEHKLLRLLKLRGQLRSDLSEERLKNLTGRQVGRLLSVHRLSLNKHGNDKQLWNMAFDCAKNHSVNQSRALFLRALMIHPDWTQVWIQAAQYEHDWHNNPTNARMLLQRGIDVNRQSVPLYSAFFSMELEVAVCHMTDVLSNQKKNNANTDTNSISTDISTSVLLTNNELSSSDLSEMISMSDGIGSDDSAIDWKRHLLSIHSGDSTMISESVLPSKVDLSGMYGELQLPRLIFKHAMRQLNSLQRFEVFDQMLKSIQTVLEKPPLPKDPLLSSSMREQSTVTITNPETGQLEEIEINRLDPKIKSRIDTLVQFMFDYIYEFFGSKDCTALDLTAHRRIHESMSCVESFPGDSLDDGRISGFVSSGVNYNLDERLVLKRCSNVVIEMGGCSVFEMAAKRARKTATMVNEDEYKENKDDDEMPVLKESQILRFFTRKYIRDRVKKMESIKSKLQVMMEELQTKMKRISDDDKRKREEIDVKCKLFQHKMDELHQCINYLRSGSVRSLKRMHRIAELNTDDCTHLVGLLVNDNNDGDTSDDDQMGDSSLLSDFNGLSKDQRRHVKQAQKIVKECIEKDETDARLWMLSARLSARMNGNHDLNEAVRICRAGIRLCRDNYHLWSMLVDLRMTVEYNDTKKQSLKKMNESSDMNDDTSKTTSIDEIFRSGIHHSSDDRLKKDYIDWSVCNKRSSKQIAEVVDWFASQCSGLSIECYQSLISICDSLALSSDHERVVQRLFARAITERGQTNASIWIWIVRFARKHLSVKQASDFYQRALRTLDAEQVQIFYSLSKLTSMHQA